jgi:uncharacterized NAD-dependent epimerase/dehydratase family protein
MYYSQAARLAIYAEGEFGKGHSKTAEGVLRYGLNPVVAVIDSTESGKTVEQVTGIPNQTPIVGSLSEALAYKPEALLLGTAWAEGRMPAEWKPDIIMALKNGLDVINGLHDFLCDDQEIAKFASVYNRKLLDVRRPPDVLPVGSGLAATVPSYVCLTVGTDGSVGKMTTSLELHKIAATRGFRSRFVATGQTGIMIDGHGIAIDRVIGDFMAGATELLVMDVAEDSDFIFVEGQGSLLHPGWSSVTLGILHGACPAGMILCHDAKRTKVGKDKLQFEIPKLSSVIPLYETMAAIIKPSKVLGIALNTHGMSEEAARKAVADAQADTGLPATDPVRWGADCLFDAIKSHRETVN